MDRFVSTSGQMVGLLSFVHIFLGLMVAVSGDARGTSATAGVESFAGPFTGWLMVASGACALLVFTSKRQLGLLWLLPQAFVSLLCVRFVGLCALSGQYPDGTQRPPLFILADQTSMLVISLAATFSALIAWRHR